MNDSDMSDMISKLSTMLNKDNIPENLKDILGNLNHSSTDSNKENKNDSNSDDSTGGFNLDIDTMLKIKTIMEGMNTKNDPNANLLLSLKPYLSEKRKDKVEQYVKFMGMGKVMGAFNLFGGDKKNDK